MTRAGRRTRSPWLGVSPGIDPRRWATLLRKAHRIALDEGAVSPIVRPLVKSSWSRAVSKSVDPDACAPMVFSPRETTSALAKHPVSGHLPKVEKLLREATEDAEYFVVLSDAEGVLLWIDGHQKALEIAVSPGFLPGHLCSEAAVGTNAVGTALELGHPVQIFSAEHFNRRLHGLTCTAAPIRDPGGSHIIGALNLSGSFRSGHPHSLPLISAVARVVEDELRCELAQRHEQLRSRYIDMVAAGIPGRSALISSSGKVLAASPCGWLGGSVSLGEDGVPVLPGGIVATKEAIGDRDAFLIRTSRRRTAQSKKNELTLEPLGSSLIRASIGDWSVQLSQRHSEIVALLALAPAGLTVEELRLSAYGAECSPITVRAEIARLRKLLGPVLASRPYRFVVPVVADLEAIRRTLRPPEVAL